MISARDSERLCDFARARAKVTKIVNATASLHQFNPSPRLERANQNEAVRVAFHQHVQHPVNAVIEIDVRRARFVALDKAARARPRKGMRGFIIDCRIRFHLDDDPGAFVPNQFSADKFARTRKRIALEKSGADNLLRSVVLLPYSISAKAASPLSNGERIEVRGLIAVGVSCFRPALILPFSLQR
jgi:hypothetical protein